MVVIKDKNLYFVGGVVRDELLGIKNQDIDLCYVGNAIDYARANFGSNIIKENPSFGTVRVFLNDKEIDIASTRKEIYPKAGHLPVITEIGCPLSEDLGRRDFTINAIAKNTLTGEIIDLYNGISDIKNKKLKILHERSFIDDPTRIIRGLKFSFRFGFSLDENTQKLQDEYLENINYDMSYHRLKKELIETFNLDNETIYNQFISQGMYKLLKKNHKLPTAHVQIKNDTLPPDKIWIKYLANCDLSDFELSKQEKLLIAKCTFQY